MHKAASGMVGLSFNQSVAYLWRRQLSHACFEPEQFLQAHSMWRLIIDKDAFVTMIFIFT